MTRFYIWVNYKDQWLYAGDYEHRFETAFKESQRLAENTGFETEVRTTNE